jgi:cold shock CspA family protein
MKGKIRMWNLNRGFGFLECTESKDVFFHFSAIENRNHDINVGDVVEFELGSDATGRTLAKRIRVIDPHATDCAPVRYCDIGVDEAA